MAQITINIPAGVTSRVIDALCYTGGYQDTLADGSPNPIAKAAYAKQVLLREIKATTARYEARLAQQNASAAVKSEVTLS